MLIGVVMVILRKLKSVFLFIITLWRRAICCFRRRRRPSNDFEPLTQVGVVSNQMPIVNDVENWNDWGDTNNEPNQKPSTIQEHIEYYRQKAIASHQVQEELEIQQDFFEDMTPTITKQAKLFISNQTDPSLEADTTRLSMDINSTPLTGNELGEWEENSGWETQTLEWDAEAALREKRKIEREKRAWEQQQRRQEKLSKPIALGARLPS